MSEALLRAEKLCKEFPSGGGVVRVLQGVDLTIAAGEMVAVIGPSGAGKSTLLHLLGALDSPTSGALYFCGKAIFSLSIAARAEYRNRAVGFVWQRHHLLPDFTAAENVAMPLLVNGTDREEASRQAADWLAKVGLASRAAHAAGTLSGGEQQRAAMARALVAGPRLLLADEPTGDLDESNSDAVFALLQRLQREHGLTAVMATHNRELAGRCDRVLVLERGCLVPRGAGNGPPGQGNIG
jgi:lipoprotein-releasing system ATP-binding protein